MSKSKHLTDALNRLAAAEQQFLADEFLAPVVRGGAVQVRIAGVICTLSLCGIPDERREFFGIGRLLSFVQASRFVCRDADPAVMAARQ